MTNIKGNTEQIKKAEEAENLFKRVLNGTNLMEITALCDIYTAFSNIINTCQIVNILPQERMAKIDYLVKALQEMSNKMSPECHLTCGKKCKWVYFYKYTVEYIDLGTVKEVAILDGRRHRNNITRWLARELNEEEDAIAQLGENERDSGKKKK